MRDLLKSKHINAKDWVICIYLQPNKRATVTHWHREQVKDFRAFQFCTNIELNIMCHPCNRNQLQYTFTKTTTFKRRHNFGFCSFSTWKWLISSIKFIKCSKLNKPNRIWKTKRVLHVMPNIIEITDKTSENTFTSAYSHHSKYVNVDIEQTIHCV